MSAIGKIIPVSSRNFGRKSAVLYNGKYDRSYFTYTQELSQPLDRKPEFVKANEAFQKCLKSGRYFVCPIYYLLKRSIAYDYTTYYLVKNGYAVMLQYLLEYSPKFKLINE